MKVAFLDIDGVVLPVGALKDADVEAILRDPDAHLQLLVASVPKAIPQHLMTLADKAGIEYVLISTWRRMFKPDFIEEFLEQLGLFGMFHTDWFAKMRFSSDKGHDICSWLGDHPRRQRDCIAIDDDDLGLVERYGLREMRQVRPISNVGFSRDDLARAMAMLGKKELVR